MWCSTEIWYLLSRSDVRLGIEMTYFSKDVSRIMCKRCVYGVEQKKKIIWKIKINLWCDEDVMLYWKIKNIDIISSYNICVSSDFVSLCNKINWNEGKLSQ